MYTRVLVGNRIERAHLEDPSIDGRILRSIFGKWGFGPDRAGSEEGQVAGTCENGNEPTGSIKCG
jgi:hypothetical protein